MSNEYWQNIKAKHFSTSEGTSLKHNKIYILPNKQGIAYIIVCLVLLLFGVNYENNLVLIVAIFNLNILVTSLILSYKNMSGVTLLIDDTNNTNMLFANSDISIPIIINSPNKTCLNLKISGDNIRTLVIDSFTEKTTQALTCKPLTRGIYQLPLLRIESDFPLGLVKCYSYIAPKKTFVIFAKPIANDYLLCKNPQLLEQNQLSDNNISSAFKKNNAMDEIAGVKPYTPGDSLKLIDWRQLALGRGLMVKDFTSDQSAMLELNIQCIRSNNYEEQISFLTFAIIDLERKGQSFAFNYNNINEPVQDGLNYKLKLLTKLALLPYK